MTDQFYTKIETKFNKCNEWIMYSKLCLGLLDFFFIFILFIIVHEDQKIFASNSTNINFAPCPKIFGTSSVKILEFRWRNLLILVCKGVKEIVFLHLIIVSYNCKIGFLQVICFLRERHEKLLTKRTIHFMPHDYT